ncbi:hypothetical protein [Ardenticatena maritima]|uniref:Uncharacterized protein n=3 Tax=Ardenticatena maritima TaxID=872965 RepID=A0A0P6YVJ1_9CHLR|nr:hypothetical protein [Ardenticatena maritima]KPL87984.1 hypothetical protein SE16_10750 [Ardenticatena maritima]
MSERYNDAEPLGVRIEPADVAPGEWFWKAVHVHHLTPQENRGRNHLWVDVRDEQGKRLMGSRVRVRWAGGEGEIRIEKPADEPGGNMPLYRGNIYTVDVLEPPDAPLPSDRVVSIHTNHIGEGDGNDRFRHSFYVVFQRTRQPAISQTHPLPRYVLFGSPDDRRTATVLHLLDEWLATQPKHVVFGFSPDEAAAAQRVLILGDTHAVSGDIEARLRAAGCDVVRAALTSWRDIRTVLEQFVHAP